MPFKAGRETETRQAFPACGAIMNSDKLGQKPLKEESESIRIKERSAERKKKIVAHRAANFKEAEEWDLDFWQSKTPEERLSALVAIRRDVLKAQRARQRGRALTKKER